MTSEQIIRATRKWVDSFIIAHNICPFAHKEQQRNRIRYQIADTADIGLVLQHLIDECVLLDATPDTETTLLILPQGFADFEDYLDLLAVAEQLLIEQQYEGVYQLASFHPEYRFADEAEETEDPANYTNRSPYPMLHIIREASIERALAHYPDPKNIPTRNIQLTRDMGLEKLKDLLAACYE